MKTGGVQVLFTGLLASLGKGVRADFAAVKAALTEPWSNEQTEDQNTKLKLVKRRCMAVQGSTSSARALCARMRLAVGLHRA